MDFCSCSWNTSVLNLIFIYILSKLQVTTLTTYNTHFVLMMFIHSWNIWAKINWNSSLIGRQVENDFSITDNNGNPQINSYVNKVFGSFYYRIGCLNIDSGNWYRIWIFYTQIEILVQTNNHFIVLVVSTVKSNLITECLWNLFCKYYILYFQM